MKARKPELLTPGDWVVLAALGAAFGGVMWNGSIVALVVGILRATPFVFLLYVGIAMSTRRSRSIRFEPYLKMIATLIGLALSSLFMPKPLLVHLGVMAISAIGIAVLFGQSHRDRRPIMWRVGSGRAQEG